MRRHAAALLFAVGALLLTPGAAGLPNVPGDPTPPVVTPVITGTLGARRLVHEQRHRQLVRGRSGVDHPLDDRLRYAHAEHATRGHDDSPAPRRATAAKRHVSKTFKVDKTAPATTAAPSQIGRLERLVQPRRRRRLQRERHDLRARVVLPGCDLQRARHERNDGRRHLPRRRREHGACDAAAQVRRDGAADESRGAPAGRERLAQPRGHRHLPGHRRNLRRRHLHADDLLGA